MGNEADELFYELYDNYFRDVYRFVYQMVRDKEQVEDLLQEIFLLVYKNLKRFRGESEYKTWLFAIAHNHVKSFWRKWLRRKKIDTAQQQDLYRQPPVISSEAAWEKRYLAEQIGDVLQAMPSTYRDVIILRYLHDFTVSETAIVLGTTNSRVSVLTHRALAKMRDLWKDEEEEIRCLMDSTYQNA